MMRKAVILLLILSALACAQDIPVTEDWSKRVEGGVQRIDYLDLSGRGSPAAYTISLTPSKAIIHAYDRRGNELFSTVSSGQEASSEDMLSAAVTDMDGDGYLDIIASTVIMGQGI